MQYMSTPSHYLAYFSPPWHTHTHTHPYQTTRGTQYTHQPQAFLLSRKGCGRAAVTALQQPFVMAEMGGKSVVSEGGDERRAGGKKE